MNYKLYFYLFIVCILFTTINGNSKCECKCCKSFLCLKPNHPPSITTISCTDTSCKTTCEKRYPKQCGYKLGKIVAQCKKIFTLPHHTITTMRTTQKPTIRTTKWLHYHPNGAPACSSNGVCYPAK